MKSYISNILNVSINWEIGRISNWTNKVAGWDIVNRQVTMIRREADSPTFGSEANNSLMTPVGLNGNKLLFRTSNEKNSEKSVRASYGTNNNYTYNVVNFGPYTGYEPTADRVATTLDVWKYRYISVLNNNVITNWCSILTPYHSSSPAAVDANGEYTAADLTAVTWDVAELNAAALTFARTLDIAPVLTSANCDIMVPQDATMPLLAIVGVRYLTDKGQSFRNYITRVNYTGSRAGRITGYSLVTSGYVMTQLTTDNSSGVSDNRSKQPGWVIHRIGNKLLCAAGNSTISSVPGGLTCHMVLFSYDITAGTLALHPINSALATTPWGGAISAYPCVLPNYGMCIVDNDISGASYGTILGLQPMGTTEAQWLATSYNARANRFAIMAQEVKQGWIVYFTEDVPVILNGREGTAPITSIDLTTIKANPANSTFYVYVVENNGAMSYRITATEEAPTINKMYIGTIVTSGNAISNIMLKKRSRIGIYQISDTRSGTSIPVSTGMPFQIGDWSWDS
jgi:hypothetical protein